MKTSHKLEHADFIFQSIILSYMLFMAISTLFTDGESLLLYLLGQFFLGVWQVLSSLISVAVKKERIRMNYLLAVVLFIVIGIVFRNTLEYYFDFYLVPIVFWIVIPVLFALWYYRLTYRTYKNRKSLSDYRNTPELEGILDSEELL